MSITNIVSNPNRFEDPKEINIVNFLPEFLRTENSEVVVFMEFLESYLNSLYQDDSPRLVNPANLSEKSYTKDIGWLVGSDQLTSPNGTFTTSLNEGDWIRRQNETKYYHIATIVDNTTLLLSEIYSGASTVNDTFYYDSFSAGSFDEFWTANSVAASDGNNGEFPLAYKLEVDTGRAICQTTAENVIVTSGVSGNFDLQFGIHLNEYGFKNNPFAITLTNTISGEGAIEDGTVKFSYDCGVLSLTYKGSLVASLTLTPTINDFTFTMSKVISAGTMIFYLDEVLTTSSTWSDNVNLPVLGSSHSWLKTVYDTAISASSTSGDTFYMSIIPGLYQGFSNVQFQADHGFNGQLESDNTLYQGYTHISILEKVKRLAELHDPSLITPEYISYFAKYLGYNINLNNQNLIEIMQINTGVDYNTLTDEQKEQERQMYLRFIVTNLPFWTKIKGSDSSINILLYSFGLISEIKSYFTDNYSDPTRFITENVPDTFFPTPHITVKVDLDSSVSDIASNTEKMNLVVDAVNSIKPINVVFQGITGFVSRTLPAIFVRLYNSTTLHITVPMTGVSANPVVSFDFSLRAFQSGKTPSTTVFNEYNVRV